MRFYILISIWFLFFSVESKADKYPVFKLEALGRSVYQGTFTGNGLLGTMTYMKGDSSARIDIGRTDVYDHRANSASALFDKARLLIGHFELIFPDGIQKSWGEMDYHRGESYGYYSTNKGVARIRTISFAEQNIIYIEISKGKDDSPQMKWISEKARSTRMNFGHAQKPDYYPENPLPYTVEDGVIKVSVQPLLAGGGYATAYKKIELTDKDVYLVTVSYSQSSDSYIKEAIQKVSLFDRSSLEKSIDSHRKWWEKYYERSNLILPDEQLQQFYNMQLYKLGCATRSDKPAIDLQGPWPANTPWPAYWHNLNIQLTYSPTFTANHLEITSSLINMIDQNVDNLINNVPEQYRYNSAGIGRTSAPDMISPIYLQKGANGKNWSDGEKELGNLTWMLHSYYQYYRYSMDTTAYDRLFSLLKRAVNYYIHLLDKDERGKYHIAVRTYSPEYSKGYAYDTNYDLSILRWGLKTLIALDNEQVGEDSQYLEWVDILNNLRDYPKDSNGFMIAKDLPYAESHRHYSHLMMIYPFYDVNWDQIENRDIILKSIAHWQSKKDFLQGYSFSGVASMYAMMGKGNRSLEALQVLLGKYIKPNTLYAETGPVIETPLAAMASINEMVLQYWNGSVRVFPAVPDSWKNVSFTNFLTDGAFLISAQRKDSETVGIRVKSQHSGSISLKHDIKDVKIKIQGEGRIVSKSSGHINLWLSQGAIVHISN
ncbi:MULTISPECIES: glycosyl hydrolase family 95 catalytic domain-containing protein [Sphingobacterium]|uniref:glycosyl hydrolase family 95 catalytic domain-containing protein n=1 Tax=Sphingobacterium TaxID=28453 RepID=UPI0013DBBEF7|nr:MULTISPECIES: hypothetical protein [unclassified Sphingobacterium]